MHNRPNTELQNNHEQDIISTQDEGQKRMRNRAFVIAVANQKGGVAKTTTVVSLGGALVNHEQEVLLVDLDAQANLTLALGKDPTRVRGAITDVLFDSATLLSVSRETEIPGLDMVPSNNGMELAERFLPVRKNYETILERAIRGIVEPRAVNNPNDLATEYSQPAPIRNTAFHTYDFVILDCPPFMGAVTLNALNAADMLVIPTQPEYFSAHALRTMMATIRQVRDQQNPNLVYRILITMYDGRNRIHRDVREQIQTTFSEGIFSTTVSIDTKLRESAVEGLPITHFRKRSRSSHQYNALAQELIAYVQQT